MNRDSTRDGYPTAQTALAGLPTGADRWVHMCGPPVAASGDLLTFCGPSRRTLGFLRAGGRVGVDTTPAVDALLKQIGVGGLRQIRWAALLVATASAFAFVVVQLRNKHQQVSSVVDDIEGQVAALDPVTRAAVLARLGADSAKVIRERAHD